MQIISGKYIQLFKISTLKGPPTVFVTDFKAWTSKSEHVQFVEGTQKEKKKISTNPKYLIHLTLTEKELISTTVIGPYWGLKSDVIGAQD